MEIYKKIKGFDNYEISNYGNVKSLIVNSPGTFTSIEYNLKRLIRNNGYEYYSLKNNNNKFKKLSIHRLIAEAFIENKENKLCVNHKNGIRNDNRIENLEWVTYSENSFHGYNSNGRINPRRNLTENEVIEIKKELINYKYGMGLYLAKKYNVSKWIISLIKNNKTYKLN